MRKPQFLVILVAILFLLCTPGITQPVNKQKPGIKTGADRMEVYLPLLKGKRVALFANQTTVVGPNKVHLADTLLKRGVQLVKIFSPEHGFRGTADAGEKVGNSIDSATGIPIVSLYGGKYAPSADEMKDVDIMMFDVQDVGMRYYTYISSLEDYMNACIENAKPLLILDRPNPNGFYVDGPILEKPFKSHVGMQPIPIVHGLTIGEYAQMLVGEKWLTQKANSMMETFKKAVPTKDTPFHMLVIKCQNYTHSDYYELPVRPSPNLPNMQSIFLYSSTCFFEGTDVSLGRGTSFPFQAFGHPTLPDTLFSFTPVSMFGAKTPPQQNNLCYGFDLRNEKIEITKPQWKQIQLRYILTAYKLFPNKDSFFLRPKKNNPNWQDYFFNKLAGNYTLMWQIMNGKTEAEIRQSWQPGLKQYKTTRKKYLLYKDFE
ncbi:exo-beta-N-acetylmuramidase NamZ domain-containing protein [Phnomibacter sp. MR]|uniref:exo-beta-N-acetylmuramidase NamZ family protein n=1 Tax=Phnomibacter sp. MR TaxID=3042318 RepID=UPI003A7FF14D